ncbi:MAG: SDR family NAD(P)-dependent oxidoreductase, partial [Comamonas sp.]|nr:SDR family NAD(P)-dependent oxidoreductase [Comamonas sp.]
MKRSHKKTALITGATGQLGWAVANFLHDQGWRLLLLARNGQAMQLAFGHLPDVVLLDVDLTQREALIARVQAALGQEAHLDAVCHLAGGFHMGDGVDALSLPTW